MDKRMILEQRSKLRLEESKTPEHAAIKEVYEELRSEILDKGNMQIKNSELDIENYDVTWNKYHYNIPIQNSDKLGQIKKYK
jgi:hypothetical protein